MTNKFPDEFYELAKKHNLYRFYMPEEYGGWGFSTLEIMKVQEEFSRGPNVFIGYLNQPELTQQVLDSDGWYYSGDLAVMDEEGYIKITGRSRDTIIRGGENISAAEIERVLMEHPAVLQAAVVAMPDRRLGERVCAFLVARSGALHLSLEEITHYFNRVGVAKYKIPERVEYLEAMPATSSGKIAKGCLRALVQERGYRAVRE
ncbi:MAG: AMP-binding protein [Actinomycetaceae bacterium]|nr:AMP-binding protein [Actinomycetaceae bacterium]MDY5854357.1 AMP-binding protein [Arcanobacterium sp.]